jgi:DNA recombination protein RmuC
MIPLLLFLLLVAVALAAYQFSEARRWRQTASEVRSESAHLAETQLRLLTQTQQQFEEKFRMLASDALNNNSQLLLDRSREQIRHVVEPVTQSLRRFEEQVQGIERARAGAYEGISAQVQALTQLQERVRQSTDQLKTALRSPVQRGRWGEMQLRRVVELAGMLEHCDFAEQKTLFGENLQRPDLIVRLPNQCQVVVDSKVSLEAYLRAIETSDEAERLLHMKAHASQVRTHVRALSEKAYWQRVDCSPEFVVAFLPLESLFSAALDHDPELLDFGIGKRVLIATPTSLISLLLAVAHGWRQHSLAEEVDKIRDTGIELYTRLLKMSENFAKLGSSIEKSVEMYNSTVGSLEKHVLPSARKFEDLRPASSDAIAPLSEVDGATRPLQPSKWKANSAFP